MNSTRPQFVFTYIRGFVILSMMLVVIVMIPYIITCVSLQSLKLLLLRDQAVQVLFFSIRQNIITWCSTIFSYISILRVFFTSTAVLYTAVKL